MRTKNLDSFTQNIEQIPTLQIVSKKIMSLLSDEDISLKRIADLIETDQSMTTKILKVANSAFYGTLNKVSSVDNALVILGIEEVKGILMTFSIYNFFSASENDGFDRSQFWKHAIISSQVARYLGQYFNIGKDDTLFLSGLIHDMGKAVLDQYFHEEFLQIIEYISSNNESFSKGEKEILGITHYQVAAKLLQQWKFPEKVIMQVFYHHAPWQDKNYVSGSIITYLANIFTKLAGYPCLSSEKRIEISTFANPKVLDFINKSGFDLDVESIEKIINQIRELISMEAQNVLSFFDE